MKAILTAFLVMIGCAPAVGLPCEFCGEWIYDRFNYTGRVTTDCEGTAEEFYKGSAVKLYTDEFSKTYYIDNYPAQINNPEIQVRPAEYLEYDDSPDTKKIDIKKDGQVIETFYFVAPDTFYNHRDGCRFYFKRHSSGSDGSNHKS